MLRGGISANKRGKEDAIYVRSKAGGGGRLTGRIRPVPVLERWRSLCGVPCGVDIGSGGTTQGKQGAKPVEGEPLPRLLCSAGSSPETRSTQRSAVAAHPNKCLYNFV